MADRLDALTVRESNGKSYWTRLGVAWPNKNGPGYIVKLDAVPAPTEGQFVIHLREPLPREGRPQSMPDAVRQNFPSATYADDDLPDF